MSRRHFLSTLALLPATALADSNTARLFHAALARDPSLVVVADTRASQAGSARVSGRLPADLHGQFYRNGPGRMELGGERYHHWFDGDGFAQCWRIGDGKVAHQGCFVATQKFTEESAAGQFLYPAFGTHIDRRAVKNNDTMNAANTNLLPFAGKLYALWEGGSAVELAPATLATVGLKTWREDLRAMPFSAHPKIDQDGSLWNFGALPGADRLALYQVGADGALRRAAAVDVPQLAMVHDFAISERHLVFLVAPYDFSSDPTRSFAERHQWNPARPLRAIVIAKSSLAVVRTFELPPRSVFHFGNAYDDGRQLRFDAILHQGDAIAAVGQVMAGQRPAAGRAATTAISLDLDSGAVHEAVLLAGGEFPRVMPQVVGRRHRRLAVVSSSPGQTVLDTVNLVDTDQGRADSFTFDAGWVAEEHLLLPRRNARHERDGYLVGVVQDTVRAVSALTVFDCARIADGPVAMARLAYRTPHCFHGNFLPT
ncbi:carotenoid oxygenase family protein [Massilia sp. DWR3-1-1]|uniref:carotenoid oxygenase family protein n=1 Tax=Massilia sp. DWR3-1-1 TaxID=2804559 RepID=UPI003CEAAB32